MIIEVNPHEKIIARVRYQVDSDWEEADIPVRGEGKINLVEYCRRHFYWTYAHFLNVRHES